MTQPEDYVTTGRQVPYCLFTDPELARIGLNENQAKASTACSNCRWRPCCELTRFRKRGAF